LTNRELLERLVSFDTTSVRSNVPVAEFICDYLDSSARSIERLPSADGQKENIVAWFGPESDPGSRRGLVLSGHMDVVPACESGWKTPPFVLRERDGTYYGRGTADMKGFLALAINAAVSAVSLRASLVLVFTHDEETGCLGASRLVEQWPADSMLPRAAIIGEPTSLRLVRMHKGHLKLKLTVHGRSAHSGYPHLGVNAIELSAGALDALIHLREVLQKEPVESSRWFEPVPHVTLNVGTIRGGSAINVVPDSCEIEIGLRPLPGVDVDDLTARVRAALMESLPEEAFELETISNSPAMELDQDRPIYRTLSARLGQEETRAVSFATDAGWLQQLDLDCILFGPGSIEVAHRPNEFLPRDEFVRAAGILDEIIGELCS
ncbi:MAG TPA: acetylornithine deacetylase, partial [Thermoanaerobaculia bacterium]|nr:acetylornithine deacetylase [Thermoanaerobaculia bacterium]